MNWEQFKKINKGSFGLPNILFLNCLLVYLVASLSGFEEMILVLIVSFLGHFRIDYFARFQKSQYHISGFHCQITTW